MKARIWNELEEGELLVGRYKKKLLSLEDLVTMLGMYKFMKFYELFGGEKSELR